MKQIKIIGFAQVTDCNEDLVTDPQTLKGLDGIVYDDEFQTDYIGGSDAENNLQKKLNRSGNIHFSYKPGDELLTVESIFETNEKLTDEELKLLAEDTIGQWSDGMGENFTCESSEKYGFTIMCLDREDMEDHTYPRIVIK